MHLFLYSKFGMHIKLLILLISYLHLPTCHPIQAFLKNLHASNTVVLFCFTKPYLFVKTNAKLPPQETHNGYN